MRKRILAAVLAMFVLTTSSAFAAENEITKEYTFVTDKDAELEFADVGKGDLSEIPLCIEVGGKTYHAVSADFSLEKKPTEVQKTYEDLDKKEVPETIKKYGEELKLADTKWTETKRSAATGTKRYYGYNTQPEAPATKEITATLPSGKTITVTGSFVDIKRVKGDFTKPFEVTAKFIGGEDVENYILPDGSKIPNDESIPVFKGYEDIILKNLGYSTKNYRITGGKWITDYYDENGETCRKAQFTGTQRGTDWVATYRETLTENSVQYATYTADCTYRSDDMTVKATVAYEKESGINKTILMIAGILLALMVIAGVISGILMTAKKRKKEETENERAAKRQKGKKLW